MELKELFINLVNTYTTESGRAGILWDEIEKHYSHKSRHYHNLAHLDNLLHELTTIKEQIGHWDAMLFAIFYHDVIYNVMKKDNEERSAVMAGLRLSSINFPVPATAVCCRHIEATKSHELNHSDDTNLFTDADLSILGKDGEQYKTYCEQVRKEYSIYPDMIYKPGRKKVLGHFLGMERIYKTEVFYDKYEMRARENMRREMAELL